MSARNEFDGAIFEGVLLGATMSSGRGSSFGTVYDFNIPVYDPLNPSNIMTIPTKTNHELPGNSPAP